MKGLFIIIGESFRSGGQHSRIRGDPISYGPQIKALKSHILFLNHIIKKFIVDIKIIVSTYNTPYNKTIKDIYNHYLQKINIFPNPIGLQNLFYKSIPNNLNFDFIFYFRIDLYLKDSFFNIFDPNLEKISYLCPCWKKGCLCKNGHPRVSDVMMFFPKKYFNYLNKVKIYHNSWQDLVTNHGLEYKDLEMISKTYHDSNTSKDFNPYYRIVNRPENTIMHSDNYYFDKRDFNQYFNKTPTINMFKEIKVLSINHNNDRSGKFFHFDSNEIISLPLKQHIINNRNNKIDEIIIWNYNNGGILGNYHGRYIKSSTVNDFKVNDILTYLPIELDKSIISKLKGIKIQVLSVFYKDSKIKDGRYFNFNCNHNLLKVNNVFIVNLSTNQKNDGAVWKCNNQTSYGRYQGKYNNSNKEDFKEKDIIYLFFKNKIINL